MAQYKRTDSDQTLSQPSMGSSRVLRSPRSGDFSFALVLPPHPTPSEGESDSSLKSRQPVAAYAPAGKADGSVKPPPLSALEKSRQDASPWGGDPPSAISSLGITRRISADVAELEATIDQLRHEKDRLEHALLAERSVCKPLELMVNCKGHVPVTEKVEERGASDEVCCSEWGHAVDRKSGADRPLLRGGLRAVGELPPLGTAAGAAETMCVSTEERLGGQWRSSSVMTSTASQNILVGGHRSEIGHAITIEEFLQLQEDATESRKENVHLREQVEEGNVLVRQQEQEMEELRGQIAEIRAQWERERVKLGSLVTDLEQKITEEKRRSRERDKVLMQRLSAQHSRTESEISALCMELDSAQTYAKEAQAKLEYVSRIAEAEKESVQRLQTELSEIQESMVEKELLLQQENTVLRCELAELQGSLALGRLPDEENLEAGSCARNNEKRMLQVEVAEALRDSIGRMKSLMKAMRHEQAINGRLNAKVKELLIQVQSGARKKGRARPLSARLELRPNDSSNCCKAFA
ncbi:hypothetical protein CBR_g50654 [Chara braunii]|uniref:Uncharacterized protein n=1 Tax=Chara braunii TaxID=69332 RepID=A0A388M7A0_CHABU|nr:hypothetical protein CBR_g50654 [Chara braunii]|eukprot:GBG90406.1 hypothetical protein CBR_g50654 [Chara braunii]